MATDFVILQGLARQGIDRRVDAHRLLQHRAKIGKPGQVISQRITFAEHACKFSTEPFRHIRMVGEQVERPCHSRCCRLVSGKEQRLGLIDQRFSRKTLAGSRITGSSHRLVKVGRIAASR